MEQKPDYYRILGVLPTSEDVVIRGVYRALVQKYHPDTFDGDPAEAERKTREINAAYATLRDPQARASYDAERAARAASPEIEAQHPASVVASTSKAHSDFGQPAQASLAGALHKWRHALITAGYLASLLLIFFVARAALNMSHSNSTKGHDIARARASTVEADRPAPALSHSIAPPPKLHGQPNKRIAPRAGDVLPAQHGMAAKKMVEMPLPALRPPALAAPTVQAAAAPVATAVPPPAYETETPAPAPHAAHSIKRHAHRVSPSFAPETINRTGRSVSDEEQTRWLNDRSAVSRPRWHPARNWRAYRPQSE